MSARLAVSVQGTGRVLGDRVAVADGFLDRLVGLLGRGALGAGEGLVLEGCAGVHTCFMRFPIDVCFLDPARRVLRTVEALPPWRAARAFGARSVLELPAGALSAASLREGDILEFTPCA